MAVLKDGDYTAYLAEFSENNSGGGWWLNDADWAALREAGWDVDPGVTGEYGGHRASKRFYALSQSDAYDAARQDWENATNENLNEEGCSCCGQPFYIYMEEVEVEDSVESSTDNVESNPLDESEDYNFPTYQEEDYQGLGFAPSDDR